MYLTSKDLIRPVLESLTGKKNPLVDIDRNDTRFAGMATYTSTDGLRKCFKCGALRGNERHLGERPSRPIYNLPLLLLLLLLLLFATKLGTPKLSRRSPMKKRDRADYPASQRKKQTLQSPAVHKV